MDSENQEKQEKDQENKPIEESVEEPVSSAQETPTTSWWSGWYETAVEKSSQALDSMKKDISELTSVVSNESRNVMSSSVVTSSISAVSSTASYLKDTVTSLVDEGEEDEELVTSTKDDATDANEEQVKPRSRSSSMMAREQSFEEDMKEILKIPNSLAIKASEKLSSAFKVLVDVLSPTGYDDDDVVILPGDQFISRDRWDLLIRAIQSDPRTYIEEPEGSQEEYQSWLSTFKIPNLGGETARILETSPEVRGFHKSFVPEKVSDATFWLRYFYRVEQLRDMEATRSRMLRERQEEEKMKSQMNSQQTSNSDQEMDPKLLTPKNSKNRTPVSSKGTSCESPASGVEADSRASSSEDWEKTSMTECIVDEAAKKLAEKIEQSKRVRMSGTKSDEEMGDWELE